MQKCQWACFLFVLISAGSLSSQQLTPFVVSTSGGFYTSPSGMLSFTTAEMAAVETYSSPAAILTQGFQQVWDIGTFITEHPDQNFSFDIYPNPTAGRFNLVTESPTFHTISVRILDVLGKEILTKDFYHQDLIHIQPFDLSHAAPGIYFIALRVKETDSGSVNHYIRKIQIVNY